MSSYYFCQILFSYQKFCRAPLLLSVVILLYSNASFAELSPETIIGAKTVNIAQAQTLFEQEALFVDVRKNSDWDAGRIPGAVHLDLKKNFTKQALLAEAELDERIVIYCNGPKCLRSAKATKKAIEWGFKSIHYYRDGFPAWKKAGLAIE